MIAVGSTAGHTLVMSSSAAGEVTCVVIRDAVAGRSTLRCLATFDGAGNPADAWWREQDVTPAEVLAVYDMAEISLEAVECIHHLPTVREWAEVTS